MAVQQEVLDRIPHRPPFLWVDEIIEIDTTTILTQKTIPVDLELFQGHYPDRPLMPGVLLCEAIFQSGALLMSYILESEKTGVTIGVPVLTRINGAKFKRMVYPGDTVQISVSLKETIGTVSFMKGTMRIDGKVAVQVDFSCAIASPDQI